MASLSEPEHSPARMLWKLCGRSVAKRKAGEKGGGSRSMSDATLMLMIVLKIRCSDMAMTAI